MKIEYNSNNPFAKIIAKELHADVVFEDDQMVIFHDINPVSQPHVLAVPKGKYSNYSDFVTRAPSGEVKHFFSTISEIAKSLSIEEGFKLLINNGNLQEVPHFHVHILGTKKARSKKL